QRDPARPKKGEMLEAFVAFECQQHVHAAVTTKRRMQFATEAHLARDASEAAAQPVNLAFLDIQVRQQRRLGEHVYGEPDPLASHPGDQRGYGTSGCGCGFHSLSSTSCGAMVCGASAPSGQA